MRTLELCCVLTFVGLPLTADPGKAPILQWVKQISGSGQSFATASAVDSQGNLYITGNTASTDFPVVSAAQPRPGGSTLTRVDAASGVAQKLYDPLLSSAASFSFDPQNPSTIYASSSTGTGFTDAGSNWVSNLIRSTALLPADLGNATTGVITVSSSGVTSNSVVMPTAAASPSLYSADGSGLGPGYILNSDGTLNSPSNPAPAGSAITIFATGVGSITESGPYAVAALPISVFIGGVYADGIAADLEQPPGLPAATYALSVFVPSHFNSLPPSHQVSLALMAGTTSTQQGILLSVQP